MRPHAAQLRIGESGQQAEAAQAWRWAPTCQDRRGERRPPPPALARRRFGRTRLHLRHQKPRFSRERATTPEEACRQLPPRAGQPRSKAVKLLREGSARTEDGWKDPIPSAARLVPRRYSLAAHDAG
eukprot:scaffold67146_cov30-Tisochrysis_lutea.AAC.3